MNEIVAEEIGKRKRKEVYEIFDLSDSLLHVVCS